MTLVSPMRPDRVTPISRAELVTILLESDEDRAGCCPKSLYDYGCNPVGNGCNNCALNPEYRIDILRSLKKETIKKLRKA
jgi:hypothetical protein